MARKVVVTPGEWLTAIGTVFTLLSVTGLPFSTSIFRPFGLALLLSGGLTAMREIREKNTQIAADLVTLQADLRSVKDTVKAAIEYGSAVSLIGEALSEAQANITASHVRAGGEALQYYALTVLRGRAKELRDLTQKREMTIREYNYISDFLKYLANILGRGSGPKSPATWFGITRLTGGWLKDEAEPGYPDFVEAVQKNSQSRRLSVLRIYAYRELAEIQQLNGHLQKEVQAGITVRTLFLNQPNTPDPADLTLIWPPASSIGLDELKGSKDPGKVFTDKGISPICGIEFSTRGGRLISEVEVLAQGSPKIDVLQRDFAKAWAVATPYPPSPTPTPSPVPPRAP